MDFILLPLMDVSSVDVDVLVVCRTSFHMVITVADVRHDYLKT